MVAAVALQPFWNVAFRHIQSTWIIIADIEDGQWMAVVILRYVIESCRTTEPVHDTKADTVLVKDRLEHAANSPFLAPNLDAFRLLLPEIASIGTGHALNVLRWIIPSGHLLKFAGLVDDPSPRNRPLFASLFQQAVEALHVVSRHRRNKIQREQFIADATPCDRLAFLGNLVHRLDQIERVL